MKKSVWLRYLFWIALTELVGFAAGWLIRDGAEFYKTSVSKPPLSPPNVVFPIVWGILYLLMGIGAARISLTPPTMERRRCLSLFLVQLAINFCWPLIFFNGREYGVSLAWLAALFLLVLWMLRAFRSLAPAAGWLQLPYLLWLGFAFYLNAGVWLLNRP